MRGGLSQVSSGSQLFIPELRDAEGGRLPRKEKQAKQKIGSCRGTMCMNKMHVQLLVDPLPPPSYSQPGRKCTILIFDASSIGKAAKKHVFRTLS